MPPRFATRVDGIRPFLAMEVMERAFAMEREGAPVIHLEVGEPDFAPPPAAVKACIRALESGAIVAVKGLGGFHLFVDASRGDAVGSLRERKHRWEKPFAVMVAA